MLRTVSTYIPALLLVCALAWPDSASTAKSAKAKPTAKAQHAKPTVRTASSKTTAGHTTAGRRTGRASKARTAARHAPAPTYQQHPDTDRYIEIQKALAERGYYRGDQTGEWNPDSVDALRRFQTDQKLPDNGKINALSLSALGLGPKHDGVAASAPSPAPAPTPTAPPPE